MNDDTENLRWDALGEQKEPTDSISDLLIEGNQ